MKKKTIALLVALPVLAGLIFFLVNRSQKAPEPAAPSTVLGSTDKLPITSSTVTVLYQSARNGSLEPCGCHTTPFGGIDREFNALKKIKAENPRTIYLDPGNMLAPLLNPDKRAPFKLKAHTVVETLNKVGLSVFSPGPNDVSLGVELLKELQKKAKFEFVSSNLADKAGKPLFAQSTVLNVGPWKIGITGVSPDFQYPEGKVLDPAETLKATLTDLSTKADWIIVLSQMDTSEDNEKLLEMFPQIQVLLGVDPKRVLPNGEIAKSKKQILLNQRPEAFYMGRLDIEFKKPLTGMYSKTVATLNKDAVAGWKSSLESVTPERKKELETLIAQYETERVLEPVEGTTHFTNVMIGLDEATYGQKNELSDAVTKYKEALRQEALK